MLKSKSESADLTSVINRDIFSLFQADLNNTVSMSTNVLNNPVRGQKTPYESLKSEKIQSVKLNLHVNFFRNKNIVTTYNYSNEPSFVKNTLPKYLTNQDLYYVANDTWLAGGEQSVNILTQYNRDGSTYTNVFAGTDFDFPDLSSAEFLASSKVEVLNSGNHFMYDPDVTQVWDITKGFAGLLGDKPIGHSLIDDPDMLSFMLKNNSLPQFRTPDLLAADIATWQGELGFTLGYDLSSPDCYIEIKTKSVPTPAPEPTTMLLGLLGVAGVSRLRKK